MSSVKKPSLAQQIEQLPKEKMPERDLWQGIEHAILTEQPEAKNLKTATWMHMPKYALAASICVLALVSYFSFESGKTLSGQELVQQLSQQHSQQKQSLLASFEGQASATGNWQEQLNELDEAAEAIKKALKNEPNNVALLNMLKRVHEQQIALIERVHAPAWQQI